ncbi:Hypothetical predicted protein [Mytilus galloprovincialis]|uniref:Uncharacterized protein n=1 Tax=Mytilus galloprovincialis TaxID=29158 RepID=A0A8B6BYK5_MYTGA|nr:Hypothetical predicted protein [Mytilus galloprovincialis]
MDGVETHKNSLLITAGQLPWMGLNLQQTTSLLILDRVPSTMDGVELTTNNLTVDNLTGFHLPWMGFHLHGWVELKQTTSHGLDRVPSTMDGVELTTNNLTVDNLTEFHLPWMGLNSQQTTSLLIT